MRRATRDAVYRAILDVAPDLDEAGLEPTTHLHDELGLDSIDLVNIAKAIEERTGVVIPEADYARLHRISQLVDFVAERRTQKP